MSKKEMKKRITDLTERNGYLEIKTVVLMDMLMEKGMISREEFDDRFMKILEKLDLESISLL